MKMIRLLIGLSAGLLFTSAALAADIALKAPLSPQVTPVASWSWTGFYLGAQAGYGWSNDDTTVTGGNATANAILRAGLVPTTIGTRMDGGLVGGYGGYNFQIPNTRIVAGVEAAWAWSALKGTAYGGGNFVNATYTDRIKGIFDILGRVGYLLDRNTMVYATGGASAADVSSNVALSGLICGGGVTCTGGASSSTKWGGTIGAGVERRFGAVTTRIQYTYSDFGTQTTPVSITAGRTVVPFVDTRSLNVNRFTVGAAYNF